MWPGHEGNSAPPHSWAEGIPSSPANALRKLFGIVCCHGVSVWALSFLIHFVISIFGVTIGFLITLLFPAYYSYLNWWSWPFVPPAGAGEWQWLLAVVGESENTIPTNTMTEGENAKWMNVVELLSLKWWRCFAQWQEWCTSPFWMMQNKSKYHFWKNKISLHYRKNIHLFHPFWNEDWKQRLVLLLLSAQWSFASEIPMLGQDWSDFLPYWNSIA